MMMSAKTKSNLKYFLRHPVAAVRGWLASRGAALVPPAGYKSWDDVPAHLLTGPRPWTAGVDDVQDVTGTGASNLLVPLFDAKAPAVAYGDDTCVRMVTPQEFGIKAKDQLEAIASGQAMDWGLRSQTRSVPLSVVLASVKAQAEGVKTHQEEAQAQALIGVLEKAFGRPAATLIADAEKDAALKAMVKAGQAARGQAILDSVYAATAVATLMDKPKPSVVGAAVQATPNGSLSDERLERL